MPGARSSGPRRAIAAALALAAAGCVTREIEVHPFAVAVEADGAALPLPPTLPALLVLRGTGTRVDATTLRIADVVLGKPVTIRFSAAGGVAFPTQLDGADVEAEVWASDDVHAPGGAPLPHSAMRVGIWSGGVASFHFALGEGDLRTADGLPVAPPLLRAFDAAYVPVFDVASDLVQFEPSSCGLLYYDLLRAYGDDGQVVSLLHDETGQVTVEPAGSSLPPWTVKHLVTFHRSGCSRAPRTWTQFAAWRSPPQ